MPPTFGSDKFICSGGLPTSGCARTGNDGRQRIAPVLPLPLFWKPFTTYHSSISSEFINRIVDAMATAKTSEDNKQPDQVAGGRNVAPARTERQKRRRSSSIDS